jgi:hypothetical protein
VLTATRHILFSSVQNYTAMFVELSLYIAFPFERKQFVDSAFIRHYPAPFLYLPYIGRTVVLFDVGPYKTEDLILFLRQKIIRHATPPMSTRFTRLKGA